MTTVGNQGHRIGEKAVDQLDQHDRDVKGDAHRKGAREIVTHWIVAMMGVARHRSAPSRPGGTGANLRLSKMNVISSGVHLAIIYHPLYGATYSNQLGTS